MNAQQMQVLDREQLLNKAFGLLENVGKQFRRSGFSTEDPDFSIAHDAHGFYQLAHHPDSVIHIQVYPGMSDAREAQILVSMMDRQKMLFARSHDGVSMGNEHQAVSMSFENFGPGTRVSWDEAKLASEIEAVVRPLVDPEWRPLLY